MKELPRITVIVPCRNEEKFLGRCLGSIVRNDFPHDRLEVLVVDGMSEDGTWHIIQGFSRRFPFVRGLRNPKRITPAALNLGIQNASGEIIFRIDAHATVSPDYFRLCVETLLDSSADNVGGAMETLPRGSGLVPLAIALSISHPFGVGNSSFRITNARPILTDTVFGGCYRREVFNRIGLFNERLPRGQDMEFNLRIIKAGGRILLDPRLKSAYFAAADLGSFWRHNFHDGQWAVLPFAYSSVVPIRLRHAVPLVFVLTTLTVALCSWWYLSMRVFLYGLLTAYLTLSFGSSAQSAWRARTYRLFFLMPLVFGIRHIAYGVGSAWGMIRLLRDAALLRRFVWRLNCPSP
ncbi:MAG TPA: glycosyltransferase family 2 protein [Candidatus Acidoferrales bacterium]|nr:glycosyltransferase family 2 protein [Candidatus Acidoferrales bacterium]